MNRSRFPKAHLSVFTFGGFVMVLSTLTLFQGAAQSFDRRAMLENIALNVILPCYETFAQQAALLTGAAQSLAAAPDAETLAEAKDAWNDAAAAWAQCAPYGFGGLDAMILYNQVFKTPVNPLQIEKILDDASAPDAVFTDKTGSSARGLGTLEYFLFQDDEAVLVALREDKRAAYLTALAANVQAKAAEIVTFWSPDGENYAATFAAADQEGGSVKGSLNRIVNELIATLEQTAHEQVTGPSGALDPAALGRVRGNLLGAQRLFTGADGLGIDDYLRFLGVGDLADEVTADFETALAETGALADAAEPPETERVARLYDHLDRLTVLTAVDTANQLGITVTFNDTDGD